MKALSGINNLFHHPVDKDGGPVEPNICPRCSSDLTAQETYQQFSVCENCRYHFALLARRRVGLLADRDSFKEQQRRLVSTDPLEFSDRLSYRQRLDEARRATGLLDAVITGTCKIGGRNAVLAVVAFEFMGGSMGSVVGEKITAVFELAIEEGLPLITVVGTGGARMQEGMLSLVQMAKTAAAAEHLHGAGLPYISVLTNPTTGGIYASFASLGDITVAEPHALIGFAGPRVVEQTTGRKLPTGSHTAEFQLGHGMLDEIIDRTELRDYLVRVLSLLCPTRRQPRVKGRRRPPKVAEPDESPWEMVSLARRPDRPTSLSYLKRITEEWVEINGDRLHGDDLSIVCGFAELGGRIVVSVGQERGSGEAEHERRGGGRTRPTGFRKAQRALHLAAKFHVPVICLVDTPGANPDIVSEENGLGRAIATTLATMSDLPVPIISAIIGEGGSGGALALSVADRVLMLEHAVYSVIAPEGAAAILYRDASRAEDLSKALRLTAYDCKQLGVVDGIVPEPEGAAHANPDEAARILKQALIYELAAIERQSPEKLIKARYRKFRKMGRFKTQSIWGMSRVLERLSPSTSSQRSEPEHSDD